MCQARCVRRAFDGLGIFIGGSAVFLVIGIFALVLEVQSPTWVLWYGVKVHGVTQYGLTSYRYKGVNYSLDNPQAAASDPRRKPTTVWLSKSDPTNTSKAEV